MPIADLLRPSKYVRNTVKRKRINICDKCEFRKNRQCSLCGCFYRQKAKLSTEDCPKQFWPN